MRSTHRRAAPLLLFFLALAFAVPSVAVRAEDSAAETFFDEGEVALGKTSAGVLWKAAAAAAKKSLFDFATQTAERVIELDPDHKKARRYLGYAKKRGRWTRAKSDAAKVLRENQMPKGVSNSEFAKRVSTWRVTTLPAAESKIAELYAALGKKCAAKGFEAAAQRAFREALRRDPNCASARATLGYEKVGEAWLTAVQIAARAVAAKPEAFEEESDFDELLERNLTKVRSANFVIESVFSKTRTMQLVEALETTYSLYLTDAGRDPNESVFARPLHGCFVQSDADWEAWIDDQIPSHADMFRPLHFYRGSGSMLLAVREQQDLGSGARSTFEDNAVHATAHVLNDLIYGLHTHAWLDEGLAYFTTLRVRGTTASWCVREEDARYAAADGPAEDAGQLSEFDFRGRIRALVRKGEDMPLRALTTRKLSDLALSDTIKAWSVVTWMMGNDRPGTIRYLSSLRSAKDGPSALEAHFGKGAEAVDDEWRAWVRSTH